MTAPQSWSSGDEREFASRAAEEATCYPDDVEENFAKENENRKMRTSHGDEEGNVSEKDCGFAPARVIHGHLACVVATLSVCSFDPCHRDAQGWVNGCSFQIVRDEAEENVRPNSFSPSFEGASEIEKLRASESSSCLLRGAMVYVIVSDCDLPPFRDEAESESANLTASEMSSSNSYCSLTCCRYAHASYAMGSSLLEEEQVPAWAYS